MNMKINRERVKIMKESQSKKKTSRLTKVIISLGVVLATTFFTFFLIGKWHSTPAKGIANESMKQVNTQQQEKKRKHHQQNKKDLMENR